MPPRAYGDVLQRRNAGRRLKMAAKYKLCVQRRVLSASPLQTAIPLTGSEVKKQQR